MSLVVIDRDGERQTFSEGNTWHIDQDKNLHLRSASNRPVASFAVGAWLSVGHEEAQA